MENKQTAFAQRSQEKYYFDHKDMDFYFSWILGREIYHGCDPDECYAVARRIPNGDITRWQLEWPILATEVEQQAEAALHAGNHVEARNAFLRACTYYRAPLFIMGPNNPAFYTNHQKMHACFQQAAALFDPPIETIAVPFQGHRLTGYFWKADNSKQPRPTLLVIGGIETFAEDCYFMVGSSGTERGYNMLTVDLPGQGLTPNEGLTFGAKMEHPVKASVDYALGRPEIDANQLAIFGFSWGGHVVFKGAQHDKRIKAMIANPPMPDVFRSVLAQQQGHNRHDPVSRTAFDQIVWRMGLKISFHPRDIGRRFGKAYDYLFHGKANPREITCPTLLLAGEGEAPVTLQIARECYEQLPHPQKKLVIFTQEEGGEAHCQVNNLALPNGVIFDWLDEVFSV